MEVMLTGSWGLTVRWQHQGAGGLAALLAALAAGMSQASQRGMRTGVSISKKELTRSRTPVQILSPRAMFKRAASMITGGKSGQAEPTASVQSTAPARDSSTNTATPATSNLVGDYFVQQDCQETGAPNLVNTSPPMSAREAAVSTGAAFPCPCLSDIELHCTR